MDDHGIHVDERDLEIRVRGWPFLRRRDRCSQGVGSGVAGAAVIAAPTAGVASTRSRFGRGRSGSRRGGRRLGRYRHGRCWRRGRRHISVPALARSSACRAASMLASSASSPGA